MESIGFTHGTCTKENMTGLHGVEKLQLALSSLNRMAKTELVQSGPQLNTQESSLYLHLAKNEPKTLSEVAEIVCKSRTEAYYMLASLQDKKLVRATNSNPIMFTAVREISINWISGEMN